ncbi:MAG: hypothetical protein HHAS10_08410 [Candidatus Altimarinota bacterium]
MGKIFKVILHLVLFIIIVVIIVLSFSWYNYNRGVKSVDIGLQERIFSGVSIDNIFSTDTGSIRRTGNTFMSIPEWYIVTLSADYTKWLEEGKNPSDFPYFHYLSDMWYMYGRITAIMDGKIPRDYEYHTMVQVIGLSTTLEFGSKAIYELTLGRITSFFGYNTQEDRYYRDFSRKYVNFILLRPWYEFPFRELREGFRLREYSIRGIERFAIISIELYLKEKYAKLIEDAAHSNFATPDIWTSLEGNFSKKTISTLGLKAEEMTGGIRIPRYYPFTEIFPDIIENRENRVYSIAGNKYIVSEFLGAEQDTNAFLSFPLPTEPKIFRSYYFTSIDGLKTNLSNPKSTLIHIYDF